MGLVRRDRETACIVFPGQSGPLRLSCGQGTTCEDNARELCKTQAAKAACMLHMIVMCLSFYSVGSNCYVMDGHPPGLVVIYQAGSAKASSIDLGEVACLDRLCLSPRVSAGNFFLCVCVSIRQQHVRLLQNTCMGLWDHPRALPCSEQRQQGCSACRACMGQ